MKIAVISDTHGLLRPQVMEYIRQCDAVIHAGDIGGQSVIDQVLECRRNLAPVYFVRGNNDREWAKHLARHHAFQLGDVNFYLVHERHKVPRELGDRQVIIYGHSHKYTEEVIDGRLWLNPGSCGNRRFRQGVTMAILHLEDGSWQAERIEIDIK